MNQHQRKFLLEAIEKQYKTEKDNLNSRKPSEPSLNNYLIAAILDGSFKMKSTESVRTSIRERVRDLGKGDALLSEGRRGYMHRNDGEAEDMISLPAKLLFDLPEGYAVELEKYEKELAEWTKEREALEASIGAMRIKVQIGSDAALMALVDQADKLCSMSLTASNRLLLGNGN